MREKEKIIVVRDRVHMERGWTKREAVNICCRLVEDTGVIKDM
jgi:hypothetical protein